MHVDSHMCQGDLDVNRVGIRRLRQWGTGRRRLCCGLLCLGLLPHVICHIHIDLKESIFIDKYVYCYLKPAGQCLHFTHLGLQVSRVIFYFPDGSFFCFYHLVSGLELVVLFLNKSPWVNFVWPWSHAPVWVVSTTPFDTRHVFGCVWVGGGGCTVGCLVYGF